MINDSYVTQNMIANMLPALQLKVQFPFSPATCSFQGWVQDVWKGGSYVCRGEGGSWLILSHFFLYYKYPINMK